MQETKSRPREAPAESSAKKRFVFGPSQIPYRILLLGKMIDRITAQHVRDTAELTLAQWRVLTHVEMMVECSAAEVASAAYSDRAEVSRAIAALEERGLIERKSNPRNRKSSLVSLTTEGHAVHDAVRGERGKFYEQWLTDLDDDQRAALDAGLERITERIVLAAPHMFDL